MKLQLYVIECKNTIDTQTQKVRFSKNIEFYMLTLLTNEISKTTKTLKYETNQNLYIESLISDLKKKINLKNFNNFPYEFDLIQNKIVFGHNTISYFTEEFEYKNGIKNRGLARNFFTLINEYKEVYDIDRYDIIKLQDEEKIRNTFINLHKKELLEISYFIQLEYWLKNLNTTPTKEIDNNTFDETPLLDLSQSKGTEKIIYLQELGILDFIQKKHPYLSVNGLANLFSAITGENTTTLQPYLNPIINSENDQRKNPYNSEKTVFKVRNKLIELNIKKLD